jgi:hypothetical protein
MDLNEIDWKDFNWIHLNHDIVQQQTVVNTAMNPRIPHEAGSFLSGRATAGF